MKKTNKSYNRIVCKKSLGTDKCEYFNVSIDGVLIYETLVYKDEKFGVVYYHISGTKKPEDWAADTTMPVGLYLACRFCRSDYKDYDKDAALAVQKEYKKHGVSDRGAPIGRRMAPLFFQKSAKNYWKILTGSQHYIIIM